MATTKQLKRYISLALGFIERTYDVGNRESNESYCKHSIEHIKIRNLISPEHEMIIKKVIDAVLDYTEESESALDEFNLSLSGVCDTCGEVILYGQDGITDNGEKTYCCTLCSINKESDAKKRDSMISDLTEYGKVRLSQTK